MSYHDLYDLVLKIAREQGRSQTILMSDGSPEPIWIAIERHNDHQDSAHIPTLAERM